MASAITNKIKITLTAAFSIPKSAPSSFSYQFDYHVCIENGSKQAVKVLKRCWTLFDSVGEFREVEGLGIKGEQPVIRPGGKFEYDSTTEFFSEMGQMHGWYELQNTVTGKLFKATIPKIFLEAPLKRN